MAMQDEFGNAGENLYLVEVTRKITGQCTIKLEIAADTPEAACEFAEAVADDTLDDEFETNQVEREDTAQVINRIGQSLEDDDDDDDDYDDDDFDDDDFDDDDDDDDDENAHPGERFI